MVFVDFNYVIDIVFVVFVMYVQFGCTFDEFIVDWVFYKMFDSNNNGFFYFVVNNVILQSMDFIGYYVFVFLFSKVLMCVIL